MWIINVFVLARVYFPINVSCRLIEPIRVEAVAYVPVFHSGDPPYEIHTDCLALSKLCFSIDAQHKAQQMYNFDKGISQVTDRMCGGCF